MGQCHDLLTNIHSTKSLRKRMDSILKSLLVDIRALRVKRVYDYGNLVVLLRSFFNIKIDDANGIYKVSIQHRWFRDHFKG